jgi:hypothetical protein
MSSSPVGRNSAMWGVNEMETRPPTGPRATFEKTEAQAMGVSSYQCCPELDRAYKVEDQKVGESGSGWTQPRRVSLVDIGMQTSGC